MPTPLAGSICWTTKQRLLGNPGLALRQPVQRAAPRRRAGRKYGLQQIAAGRGFPIQHFAGDEGAGARLQHEAVVDLGEGHAAGGRDGARDGRGAGEPDGYRLDQRGKLCGRNRGERHFACMRGFLNEADAHRRQLGLLAKPIGQRPLFARRRQAPLQLGRLDIGAQIDMQQGLARRRYRLAQLR